MALRGGGASTQFQQAIQQAATEIDRFVVALRTQRTRGGPGQGPGGVGGAGRAVNPTNQPGFEGYLLRSVQRVGVYGGIGFGARAISAGIEAQARGGSLEAGLGLGFLRGVQDIPIIGGAVGAISGASRMTDIVDMIYADQGGVLEEKARRGLGTSEAEMKRRMDFSAAKAARLQQARVRIGNEATGAAASMLEEQEGAETGFWSWARWAAQPFIPNPGGLDKAKQTEAIIKEWKEKQRRRSGGGHK